MKKVLILGLFASFLPGCPGGGACDSGDTACKAGNGNGGDAPLINGVYYDCGGADCIWTIESDGVLGLAEIDMIETGDTSWECGPSAPGAKDLVCGVWHEYHNDFRVVNLENSLGGEDWEIQLAIVDDWQDQQNNVSTLFDTEVSSTVTIMATIYDESGNWADCFVAGENTSYYSGEGCYDAGGL